MSPARTHRVVASSGVVAVLVAALGLWTFGGPEASRRESRDAERLSDIEAITNLVACHIGAGGAPPADLAAVSEGCLSATEASNFVDPATAAPYALDYPAPDVVRACAAFEDTTRLTVWVPPAFDRDTGCLSLTVTPES